MLSVEYVSSTQLKTRARPKDAALVTDYDIEVRTSSGRKGKGTTLFRVKADAESCERDGLSEFPSFAYLNSRNDLGRFSIYLSSTDGCDQVAIIDDEPLSGTGVDGVRVVYQQPYGAIIWIEATPTSTENYSVLWGMRFEIAGGQVFSDPAIPIHYVDGYVDGFDPFAYPDGSVSIAFGRLPNEEPRQRELVLLSGLNILNLSSPVHLSRLDGDCLVMDINQSCVALKSLGGATPQVRRYWQPAILQLCALRQ